MRTASVLAAEFGEADVALAGTLREALVHRSVPSPNRPTLIAGALEDAIGRVAKSPLRSWVSRSFLRMIGGIRRIPRHRPISSNFVAVFKFVDHFGIDRNGRLADFGYLRFDFVRRGDEESGVDGGYPCSLSGHASLDSGGDDPFVHRFQFPSVPERRDSRENDPDCCEGLRYV